MLPGCKTCTSSRSQSTDTGKTERQIACGQTRETPSRTRTKTLPGNMDAPRVSTQGVRTCMGSLTPRGSSASHQNDACDVAFDRSESLGAPDHRLFGAHSPAHPYRYRRFACPLTGTDARLAEKRGSVTPSFQGTSTPYLLIAVGNRVAPVSPQIRAGTLLHTAPTSVLPSTSSSRLPLCVPSLMISRPQ